MINCIQTITKEAILKIKQSQQTGDKLLVKNKMTNYFYHRLNNPASTKLKSMKIVVMMTISRSKGYTKTFMKNKSKIEIIIKIYMWIQMSKNKVYMRMLTTFIPQGHSIPLLNLMSV